MKIGEMTIKAVDVWSVECVQDQLDKAITFIDLLVDTYSSSDTFSHFTADDGEKLEQLLIIGRELVVNAYDQTADIINMAYGKK